MTMKIAFVSETDQCYDYVKGAVAATACQLVCHDFSLFGQKDNDVYPVIVVDAALLDRVGLQKVHSFCTDPRQALTFVIVLCHLPPSDEKRIRIYDALVADVLLTSDSSFILQAKINRYGAYFTDQHQRVLTQKQTEQQNQLLEYHATHDGLTGVYNHLHFQETMALEFAKGQEDERQLGLLMLDIDYFKEVNDSYGHQVGDIVLKEFAQLISGLIPDGSTWCRYGGEEFMLIMPHKTLDDVAAIGASILVATEKFIFCAERASLKITVSIGGTIKTERIKAFSTLIEQADHALYQAKAHGRNCMIWYKDYQTSNNPFEPSDNFAEVRNRLRSTLEKTRSSALASFEAMVHSQTRDHLTLQKRNKLALQMVNLLCKRLNLPRNVSQSFRRAFKLHDLLRLFISDSTLQKSGSLSEAEKLAIEDQPLMLKQLTDLFDFFADERMILRYHHECFDGSGYPEGLDGQDIPMGARLFSIVDAYVAMVVPSYSRPLKDRSAVIKEFSQMSGVQFDPFLVHILIDIVNDDQFIDTITDRHVKGSVNEGKSCET